MKETMKKEKNQNSVTKSSLSQVVHANVAKRILALIMDTSLAAFIMLGLILLVFTPIANKAFKYSQNTGDGLRYEVASELFVCVGGEEAKIYEIENILEAPARASYIDLLSYENANKTGDLEFYKARVKYYYLNYKTGVGVKHPEGVGEELYRAPNYLDEIDGKKPSELYTEEWFNEKYGEITTLDDFKQGIVDALNDFVNQDYFRKLERDVYNTKYFIYFPAFVLSFSIFFIIIPVCFKNGETLGKKTLHIGLVTRDGYQVQKRQIVFRQLLLLVYVFIATFCLGIRITAFATLGLAVLIYFIPTFISKTKRSPADMLAYTLTVDTLKSVWFDNAFVEKETEEQIEEQMKIYKSRKSGDDKHILQVGSVVVDEEAKKEMEQENKSHENSDEEKNKP